MNFISILQREIGRRVSHRVGLLDLIQTGIRLQHEHDKQGQRKAPKSEVLLESQALQEMLLMKGAAAVRGARRGAARSARTTAASTTRCTVLME
jgi:hypothetical protein